jgi:DNA relaxase NicK
MSFIETVMTVLLVELLLLSVVALVSCKYSFKLRFALNKFLGNYHTLDRCLDATNETTKYFAKADGILAQLHKDVELLKAGQNGSSENTQKMATQLSFQDEQIKWTSKQIGDIINTLRAEREGRERLAVKMIKEQKKKKASRK